MSIQNFEDRADSFYKSCQEFGIDCPGEYVFKLEPTMMGAYRDMKSYLSDVHKLPPCVFADHDTIAIGAVKAMADAVSGRGASDCKQLIGGKIILRGSTNREGRTREK